MKEVAFYKKEPVENAGVLFFMNENGELEKFDDVCLSFQDEESAELAIRILENYGKYRWHDLRKDPKDLPPASFAGYVNVITNYSDMLVGFSHLDIKEVRVGGKWYCAYPEVNPDGNLQIIAWKYIEPFEEDTEE